MQNQRGMLTKKGATRIHKYDCVYHSIHIYYTVILTDYSNAKVSKEKAQMEQHTTNAVHDKHISSGHRQMLSDTTKTKSIQHVHQTALQGLIQTVQR
jgi:hypothetical protein